MASGGEEGTPAKRFRPDDEHAVAVELRKLLKIVDDIFDVTEDVGLLLNPEGKLFENMRQTQASMEDLKKVFNGTPGDLDFSS